jgi:hypothetical protein
LPTSSASRSRLDLGLAAALVLGTLALYARTLGHDFVLFDDPAYVSRNPMVARGLSRDGVAWALRTTDLGNWAPLVWLSHMLDTSLFGMTAGPRLGVNAGLHALTALALFDALRVATGARWPSVLVAALFAWHPLHVESVAWVSSRKDVLSALGFVLALSAYVRWAPTRNRLAWALVHVFAVLGLLAKTVVVVLPFALLLLDFWPLRRLPLAAARPQGATTLWPLVREKLGLIGLCLAVLAVNAVAQQQAGAVQDFAQLPPSLRVANAVRSYGLYLVDTISPVGLAPYYPFPPGLLASFGSWLDVIASGCFLLGASLFALREARRWPWLAMGWLWYLGLLVPMIGVVQLGDQARADRYTYLPLIGLFVAAAWACADVVERRPRARPLVAAACAAALLAYAGLAWRQIGLWRGTLPLFEHTLAVTTPNPMAHVLLGIALDEAGEPEAAAPHFEAAVRLTPWVPLVRRHFLANAAKRGRLDAAHALLGELPAAPGEPAPRSWPSTSPAARRPAPRRGRAGRPTRRPPPRPARRSASRAGPAGSPRASCPPASRPRGPAWRRSPPTGRGRGSGG